ncbi:DUF4625 domain-containing protein [Ancylomarina salipaludis]|uniref:DUF4625 domain-containing protein n=1 Tax=Ancylomarina salipaludis TaxID=2501299 RepID=A0A4Q1JK27_9BACT|nr:DUF4625 domain-containing protein [Ancylomarina salipaludis]RXQ92196.1 DUF4625 domain-containing protein [Ancylomarina salipaludis]
MEILKYIIVIIFAIVFIGCEDDEKNIDEIKPNIILYSPTRAATVTVGSVLNVRALISDNKELKDYVVEINYGGVKSTKNIEEFYFSSFIDTDAYGNALPELVKGAISYNLNFDIAVGYNTYLGDYNLTLTVIDQSGNLMEEVVQFSIVRP